MRLVKSGCCHLFIISADPVFRGYRLRKYHENIIKASPAAP